MNKKVLAFDLGSSNGNVVMGYVKNSKLELEEIYKFNNIPIKNRFLQWNIDELFNNVKKGIKLAIKNNEISSIGIDTWGVDFALIDDDGELITYPVHYRDNRTDGMVEEVTSYISEKELYKLTGNQIININTLFQLFYIQKNCDDLKKAETFLLMPDLFNYLLTGIKSTEMTIASTTQLFDPYNKNWNDQVIRKFDFPKNIFTEIVKPGTKIGSISKKISEELEAPEIPVVSVCSHDTASAVVSIPTEEADFLFVSSGSWSLIGTELDSPMINEKSYKYNITNESGANNTTRFLKNTTGLWLIQESKRQFQREGREYSFSDLEKLAEDVEEFKCFIDPDHHSFQEPGNMPLRIKEYAEMTNQHIPETHGEIIRCIYESLALKYNLVFEQIAGIVEKDYKTVNIVGGGLQAELLSQMISNASGLEVSAGPIEASAIGNIIVQLISIGEIKDIAEGRQIIRNTFGIKKYQPLDNKIWQKQFKRYKIILENMNNKEEL